MLRSVAHQQGSILEEGRRCIYSQAKSFKPKPKLHANKSPKIINLGYPRIDNITIRKLIGIQK
jgi:hypothetical protein